MDMCPCKRHEKYPADNDEKLCAVFFIPCMSPLSLFLTSMLFLFKVFFINFLKSSNLLLHCLSPCSCLESFSFSFPLCLSLYYTLVIQQVVYLTNLINSYKLPFYEYMYLCRQRVLQGGRGFGKTPLENSKFFKSGLRRFSPSHMKWAIS